MNWLPRGAVSMAGLLCRKSMSNLFCISCIPHLITIPQPGRDRPPLDTLLSIILRNSIRLLLMPHLSDVTVKTAPDRSSNNPPVFRCMSLPNVTSYPAVTNLGIAEIFISYLSLSWWRWSLIGWDLLCSFGAACKSGNGQKLRFTIKKVACNTIGPARDLDSCCQCDFLSSLILDVAD